MDSSLADPFELQARFAHWRTTRKYQREAIPDELRSAALEIARRYPLSLVRRVLKLDPARLKNKQSAKHFSRATVRKSPPPAFIKLPDPAAVPSQSSTSHSPVDCRLVLERSDGSRLTLTLFGRTIVNRDPSGRSSKSRQSACVCRREAERSA